ncbi:WhiB family transcriptional regulator [Streptomyces sp. NPDC017673]|uniref:WhiB family transcriptional regulator n=1 Tax=unclassified Streptomyces TaxID=2593676 RepID=UPI003796CC65
MFADSTGQNRAKAVCTGCQVRTECLADALDNRVEWGVWGGMTERERRALLRRRPDAASCKRVLAAGPGSQFPPRARGLTGTHHVPRPAPAPLWPLRA